MILKNYKTSLTTLQEKNKRSLLSKIFKYIINPKKIFPRVLWQINKYEVEINWHDRVSEMGNSSVFSSNISIKEQKKLTKIHQKMTLKVLKKRVKKKSKLLDFGCGYGRFKDFWNILNKHLSLGNKHIGDKPLATNTSIDSDFSFHTDPDHKITK